MEKKKLAINYRSKYLAVVVVLILLIVISIPLIELIYILGIKGLFSHFVSQVTKTTGVNQYVAKSIIVILFIPLIYSFKMIFSISRKRRNTGYSFIAFYMFIFYISMFYLTKDQQFRFDTGVSMKYYAITPDGPRFFDAPGFDPKYGIQLKPLTPEIAKKLRFNKIPPQKIKNPMKFFDFVTGEAVVWFFENKDGSLDFFDQPGFHPIYREKLKPVTPEVVQKYQTWIKNSSMEGGGISSKIIEKDVNKITGKNESLQNDQKPIIEDTLTKIEIKEEKSSNFPAKNEINIQNLIAKADKNLIWQPKNIWKEALKEKNISIYYNDKNINLAAEIISRIKKLNSRLDYKLTNSNFSQYSEYEIYYYYTDLKAAQALQAAIYDITPMRISSSQNQRDLLIYLGGN